jgi:hypothetical protein
VFIRSIRSKWLIESCPCSRSIAGDARFARISSFVLRLLLRALRGFACRSFFSSTRRATDLVARRVRHPPTRPQRAPSCPVRLRRPAPRLIPAEFATQQPLADLAQWPLAAPSARGADVFSRLGEGFRRLEGIALSQWGNNDRSRPPNDGR